MPETAKCSNCGLSKDKLIKLGEIYFCEDCAIKQQPFAAKFESRDVGLLTEKLQHTRNFEQEIKLAIGHVWMDSVSVNQMNEFSQKMNQKLMELNQRTEEMKIGMSEIEKMKMELSELRENILAAKKRKSVKIRKAKRKRKK